MNNKRNIKALCITPEFIFRTFRDKIEIPSDAYICGAGYNIEFASFIIYIKSKKYPDVADGDMIPFIHPIYLSNEPVKTKYRIKERIKKLWKKILNCKN